MRPVALFDLDNTLVDRQGAYRRWSRWFAAEEGLDEDAVALLDRLDGDGFAPRQEVFAGLKAALGLPQGIDELITAYRSTYGAFFEPDPEVDAALRELRGQGWVIGVVTNGPPSQRQKLQRTGLDRLVDGWWISEELGAAKPDQRIFEAALTGLRNGTGAGPPGRTNAAPADDGAAGTVAGWMVGDSPLYDVRGGLGAGLRTVWMHRGRRWGEPDYQPDAQAGTVREAVELIVGWSSAAPWQGR